MLQRCGHLARGDGLRGWQQVARRAWASVMAPLTVQSHTGRRRPKPFNPLPTQQPG